MGWRRPSGGRIKEAGRGATQMDERSLASIRARTAELLDRIPPGVTLVAAAKGRTAQEVRAALQGGIHIVGHNYVQEAEAMIAVLGGPATWHMIGHLQRNKVRKAIRLFDLIETLDSLHLAQEIDRRCAVMGKVMPVLVEVNSGRETSKSGVFPEDLEKLVRGLQAYEHIRVEGLMTMGPRFGDPELARPFFRATREAFEHLSSLDLPNVSMQTLSMGMSNSYQIAIEEGANLVRIGTLLFGERPV